MVKQKEEKKEMAKTKPVYTEEFKHQIVQLYEHGKSVLELSREYNIAKSTLWKWTNNYKNSGSFKVADNLSEEAKELVALHKEVKQLRMENDILKQAALIMGRKSN